MLFFNTDKYNFWPVYDCIIKYYPLGITRDDGTDMYISFPGMKELDAIIVENIHEEKNFIKRWESFESTIRTETQKTVFGTTYGQAPCFSSIVELESKDYDGFTRIKELCIFVSVAGPFYTVIGRDRSNINIGTGIMRPTNFLVLSPEEEYAEPFHLLCRLIEERFNGFRFIPFAIVRQPIKDMEVSYRDEKSNTVFHALFNDQIDLNALVWGNEYFKYEDWVVDGYGPKGGWTSYPPRT